ncbi:uncharacterized protein [Procambarus clarkii]|uniref:uncharacterized protein n=1 Tax=Procambarus clarkii TaxID=6728 RepID=UPI00374373FC
MVDWETGNLRLHAGRMHAVIKASNSFPVSEMFQDDDAELNVMDFVETEYKSDKCEDTGIRQSLSVTSEHYRQRKVRSNCGVPHGDPNIRYNTRVDSLPHFTHQLINRKKKKKSVLNSSFAVGQSNNLDVSLHFPYATYLKTLCDEVGDVQNPMSDSFPSKIFDQLRHANVHYPYASLLEELHQNAEIEASNVPSTVEELYQQDSQELGIADVMRSLHYPTKVNENSSSAEGSQIESFDAPFSTMLLGMVMQQKIQDYACNHFDRVTPVSNFRGIGDILKTFMPKTQDDDPPPSELYSSALLQKFSLSAQDEKVMHGNNSFPESSDEEQEQILLWSTSESSHSEDDDFEWKPTSWKAKKVTNVVDIPKKRKSRRKKKRVVKTDCYSDLNVPSSSQSDFNCTGKQYSCSTRKTENSIHNPSSALSSRLLQLIMGNPRKASEKPLIGESDKILLTEERKSISYRCNLRRSKRKANRNNTQNNIEKVSLCWGNKLQDNDGGLQNKQQKQVKEEVLSVSNSEMEDNDPLYELPCSAKCSEPQSLLKEYLLKPAGEERLQTENCDIPKVETNFLFSRLLQNFKNLAESSSTDNNCKKGQESCTGPSILRGMLVGGNSSSELGRQNCAEEEMQNDGKSFIEHVDVSSIRECSSQNSLFDKSGSVCKVKCEQDIKMEIEEEVLCKLECEEDNFECQVCHLQFSSGMDLSNHQILFHCNEDPQTSSSHTLLPCSADSLQSKILQEKLPA